MAVRIFGIRHHGPGCARALEAALEDWRPDAVLIEGPPEADAALALAAAADVRPPVALLVYPPDAPAEAVFFPFAGFSPEWRALRHGLARDVPVRFIDLPHAARAGAAEEPALDDVAAWRIDPLGQLAEAAGYQDRELWWEHVVEQRRAAEGVFAAILEAMTAVRAEAPPATGHEALREAFMRRALRGAVKEGRERIAVVCGAWHAPALAAERLPETRAADEALLKGLTRSKAIATWIPWTNRRLALRDGYGAGVESPGWYEHLWANPERPGMRWIARAAQLLRSEGYDAPPANVVETVRMADALAALRGLPLAGLRELGEALSCCLCGGAAAPLATIRERLEIGDVLGAAPAGAPAPPLQRDLEAQQKRLRLKPAAVEKPLTLDLREALDCGRSELLHRLRLLEVPWGVPRESGMRRQGASREEWTLRWDPEFAVRLIEASIHGATVATAAEGRTAAAAAAAATLADVLALLDDALSAGLPIAAAGLLNRLRDLAALAVDVRQLMTALPRLAARLRYGDARGTPRETLEPIVAGLFARIVAGLPAACATLNDEAAREMAAALGDVQGALELLERPDFRAEWRTLIRRLAADGTLHGLAQGWCARLALELDALPDDEFDTQVRQALSPAQPPVRATAWLEGLLSGGQTGGAGRCLALLERDAVWRTLDAWLQGLRPETFVESLPLLRRAFASLEAAERRQIGIRVRRLETTTATAARPPRVGPPLDPARLAALAATLNRTMGTAPRN